MPVLPAPNLSATNYRKLQTQNQILCLNAGYIQTTYTMKEKYSLLIGKFYVVAWLEIAAKFSPNITLP